jgi:hypothetical protein
MSDLIIFEHCEMNVPEIGYMSENVEPHLNMYCIDIWEKRFVWFEIALV